MFIVGHRLRRDETFLLKYVTPEAMTYLVSVYLVSVYLVPTMSRRRR